MDNKIDPRRGLKQALKDAYDQGQKDAIDTLIEKLSLPAYNRLTSPQIVQMLQLLRTSRS